MAHTQALRSHDIGDFCRGALARARSPRVVRTAVAAAGAAMLLAAAAFWLAAPRYTAAVVLRVDPRAVEMISAQGAPVGDPAAALTAPTLLADVVALEALDGDPEFSAAPTTRLRQALGVLHRAATAPHEDSRPAAVVDPGAAQSALDGLRAAITVEYDSETARATVSVSSPSPHKAARIANTLARRYVAGQQAWNATLDARIAEAAADRRQQLLRDLRAAEADLERAGLAVASADGELLPGDLRLVEARDGLAAARQRRTAAEAEVRRAERLRSGALDADAAPAVAQLRARRETARRAIAELATRFGERHPRLAEARAELGAIDRAIDRELERTLAAARADLERATAEESERAKVLERMRNDALKSASQRAELRRLEQAVTVKRTAYESFVARLHRMADAGGQDTRAADAARIIARAEPPGTHGWLRFAVIALAGVIAGFAAAGFAAAGPLRPARGRDPDGPAGLTELTGLPLLARIAGLRAAPWWRRHRPAVGAARLLHTDGLPAVVTDRPASAAALAFTRLAALHFRPASPPAVRIVLVTAPEPGQGKSTIALNLALAAATEGRRVLLVDADPQRQALSAAAGYADAELVSVEPQPGMAWPTAPIVIDERMDVRFVCAALPRASGAAAAESLRATAQSFDVVVLDGPASGRTDAPAWPSDVATDIVLAVRRASTARHDLLAALPPLEPHAAKMRGCVEIED